MRRTALNFVLRRLVKPVWRRSPSIEQLRQRAAMVDRYFGPAVQDGAVVNESLSTQVEAQWIGPTERIREGAILYLHGGAFCIHEVTGPDEYTTVVNNNLFTNVMARFNLELAARTLHEASTRSSTPRSTRPPGPRR